MISINANIADVVANLNRSAAQVEAAAEKGLDRVATVVLNAKSQEQQKTYDRPIPLNGQGRPKWRRTGNWKTGQRIRRGRLNRTIQTEGPAEKYEERLANLPTSPDGVNRRNAAAQRAVEVTANQVQTVFESEFTNALGS